MIPINAKENERIVIDEKIKNSISKLNSLFLEKEGSPDILGLHYEKENDEIVLKSSYFIGYVWAEKNKIFINVLPKKTKENKVADFVKMFFSCMNDKNVSKQLKETYKIFTKQPKIEIKKDNDIITPFIIINFIEILFKITKQGLKKGYIKETKNLTSKIKGRISVNQTIKANHYKNRLEKTVCSYHKYTINCLENQILKTALIQSLKYLSLLKNELLISKIKNILHTFKLVDTREIFARDFTKIKLSPFFFEYKEALNLAKLIFEQLGYSLQTNRKTETIKIPPFYVNMPELFERYVETKLKRTYSDNLIPGYFKGSNKINSYLWGLRPDFIVKKQGLIIDAKYKYWFINPANENLKDDLQQLSLYGRLEDLKKDLGIGNNKEPIIIFIYPNPNEQAEKEINIENSDKIKGFSNIYKIGVNIPYKTLI